MKSIRGAGWLLTIVATAVAWAGIPPLRPASDRIPADVVLIGDFVYGSADEGFQKLDLLLPQGSSADPPRPILVAVHGGSWIGGGKRDYRSQFIPLVRAGIAVAIVDYRPARPGAPSWDGALQDVLAAADWLIREAPRFGLDPTCVATFGTSSGGLLAALAAQRDPRIRAAVCLAAPSSLIDLAAARRQAHEPARRFLGVDPASEPGRASDASPLRQVEPGGPAILLIHGDADAWVPIAQAREMHDRVIEAGGRARLIEIPGVRHGFELKVGEPSPRDLAPVVLEFLEEAWAAQPIVRPNVHLRPRQGRES